MTNYAVEIKNVYKRFPLPTGGELEACKNINITLEKGQSLGIVGESGSGKTTLVRMIMKMLPITEGEIYVDGVEIQHMNSEQTKEYRKKIQMVFQDPSAAFNPRMKVKDIILEPLYNFGLLEKGKETGEKISYLGMYKGKYLWIGLGTILLSGANFTAYSAFSNNATTYLVTNIGMTAAIAGAIYSLQGIGQLVGYFVWGSIADKFGRKVPLIGMALSAVFVFIYTRLGGDNITGFYLMSVLIGFAVGYSGAWGAYYTELFPSKYRALSSGMSFNGGRIVSTFAIPAIAGTASGSLGMMPIFYIAVAVFVAGTVVWAILPETLKKNKE